jgi:glycolate dehydrogenase FAD-binding subunit
MVSTAVRSPSSAPQLAAAIAEARGTVRVRGAGTKLAETAQSELEISTLGLDRVLEHNAGDLTAVLEAGVPLTRAQETFASADQMLALDPPDRGATIGGVFASGDSGPLRARYGGPRDLILGMRVALADGTIAKSGGKVIKNVAGYDLAKLFTGSLGTLGAIVEVSVRLHPLPAATATAIGSSADPDALGRAALALSHAPLEQLGLDVRWEDSAGVVLARFGGAAPEPQAEAARRLLTEAGLEASIDHEDEALWEAQREAQRPPAVKLAALQTDLPDLVRIASRHGATLVGRAGLGLFWLLPADAGSLLDELRGRYLRDPDPGAAALMRRVKERFDPDGKLI